MESYGKFDEEKDVEEEIHFLKGNAFIILTTPDQSSIP